MREHQSARAGVSFDIVDMDIVGIEEGYGALVTCGHVWARRCFELIFDRHPACAKLFERRPREAYESELVAALDAIVGSLTRPVALRQTLVDLGQRLAARDVSAEDYAAFRDSLLDAMCEVAGDSLSPRARNAWDDGLLRMTVVMNGAAITPSARERHEAPSATRDHRRDRLEQASRAWTHGSGTLAQGASRIREINARSRRRIRLQHAALRAGGDALAALEQSRESLAAHTEHVLQAHAEIATRHRELLREIARRRGACANDAPAAEADARSLGDLAVELHLATVGACAEAARTRPSAGISRVAETLRQLDRRFEALASRQRKLQQSREQDVFAFVDDVAPNGEAGVPEAGADNDFARTARHAIALETDRQRSHLERLQRALERVSGLTRQTEAWVEEVDTLAREQAERARELGTASAVDVGKADKKADKKAEKKADEKQTAAPLPPPA